MENLKTFYKKTIDSDINVYSANKRTIDVLTKDNEEISNKYKDAVKDERRIFNGSFQALSVNVNDRENIDYKSMLNAIESTIENQNLTDLEKLEKIKSLIESDNYKTSKTIKTFRIVKLK